jgi:hypothetical protein
MNITLSDIELTLTQDEFKKLSYIRSQWRAVTGQPLPFACVISILTCEGLEHAFTTLNGIEKNATNNLLNNINN